MTKHSIVNFKWPCFLFRYPNLDIPSQALFNLHRASALPLNLFIYQARQSLPWSHQIFWQPSFCSKRNLWRLCFDGKIEVKFRCIAAMEKKKSGPDSIFHPFSFMILPLSFREALNRSTIQFPQSKQRLHKLRFLQKLDCQKPCWDQARLCLAW